MPLIEYLGKGPIVDPADPEVIIQMVATVLTNFICLPLSVKSWKAKDYFSAIIGLGTATFSAMYHLADTLNVRLFFMTPGNWYIQTLAVQ